MSHYRLRRRDSPLILTTWWYLDILTGCRKGMTHIGPEHVIETFEVGEPVAPRFDLPNMKQSFVWIESFEEHAGEAWLMARIPGDPNLIKLNINEISKLSPLVRLAAEAF